MGGRGRGGRGRGRGRGQPQDNGRSEMPQMERLQLDDRRHGEANHGQHQTHNGQHQGYRGQQQEGYRGQQQEGYRGQQQGHRGHQQGHRGQQQGHRGQHQGHRGQHQAYQGQQQAYQGQHQAYQGQQQAYQGQQQAYQGQQQAYHGQQQAYHGQQQAYHGQQQAYQGQQQTSQVQGQAYQRQSQAYQEQPQAWAPRGQTWASQGQPQASHAQAWAHQGQPQASQGQAWAPREQPQAFQGQAASFQGQASNVEQEAHQDVDDQPSNSPPVSEPVTPAESTFDESTARSEVARTAIVPGSALAKYKYPARPGPGTKGTKMMVHTNHFGITVKNNKMIITQYNVDIKLINEKDGSYKECPKKYIRPGFQQFATKYWPDRHPAFDGCKLLFSCGPKLIDGTVSNIVAVRNDERFDKNGDAVVEKMKVTVREVNTICLADIEKFMRDKDKMQFPHIAIQALDVVLRNSGMSRLVHIGRNFFSPPLNPVSLGNGMEVWKGVFQSATLGSSQSTTLGSSNLYLNVDVAFKGFPRPQSVRDLVADLGSEPQRFNKPPPPRFNPEKDYRAGENWRLDDKLRSSLKGLKIEYEIPNRANSKRVYRVNDVLQSAHKTTFVLEIGKHKKKVTIAEYFAREKGYNIRYPEWPCFHVGSRDRKIFVPMELCRVAPNQVTMKKLDDDQIRSMLKVAATKPDIRRKNIMEAFNSLKLNEDPCLKEFNVEVASEMTTCAGRVLPAPALKFHTDRPMYVRNGSWRMDGLKFQTAGRPVENWAIIDLIGSPNNVIQKIAKDFVNHGACFGMEFDSNPKIIKSDRRMNSVHELSNFLESRAKGPFELAIVFMPDYIGGHSTYAVVKQVMELKFKILTQCIRQRTVGKMDGSTIDNILLKLNAKLDGKNHTIHRDSRPPCFNQNTMIMGADVTHPAPDSKTSPSVAAVTASHDREDMFKYNMQWRLQPPRVEEILDMEEITLEHLRYYAAKNGGKYPDRIIFYRDGVSDGQFGMVLTCELSAMRKAIRTIGQNYDPKISFLVVQKRHHTRFFPNPGDRLADKKNGNVPPGFVVDNTITHPRDMDFYLVSHQSMQGTSRPTKYKMLYDDANMSEDEVEQLTYYLCHLYSRCNRSVSYPAPTYYAHLAAFRAKHYYNENCSTVDINNERALKRESVKLNDNMRTFISNYPMFFV